MGRGGAGGANDPGGAVGRKQGQDEDKCYRVEAMGLELGLRHP